jgi:aryl-alcohol dehydrogenase-like predicted oxidoreductase
MPIAMNEGTKLRADDFPRTIPRFTPEAMETNQTLVDLLGTIAQRKKVTPAQIALAWLLARKVVPMPGTTKSHRLKKNGGAAGIELTANDLAEIERAASEIQIEGNLIQRIS